MAKDIQDIGSLDTRRSTVGLDGGGHARGHKTLPMATWPWNARRNAVCIGRVRPQECPGFNMVDLLIKLD
eukprot:1609659-Pyramimonas_sp.AAC.1